MRIKTDITALGELLIDFTPAGVSQQGMRLFEQNPGGAPAAIRAAVMVREADAMDAAV